MSRRSDRRDAMFFFRLARFFSCCTVGFAMSTVLSATWSPRRWWALPTSGLATGCATLVAEFTITALFFWRRST